MISKAHTKRIEGLLTDSVAKGANVEFGGSVNVHMVLELLALLTAH